MADDRSKPLYVDPQLLARDLGNSLSAAARAPTAPDDEAALREASRRLGIPLDTARTNPVETKRALEQDSFDPTDYASRFPSSAKYLADQENALIAKDDVQQLSEVEKALRQQVIDNVSGARTPATARGALQRALPQHTADREAEREVLRTQGFAAASRLQRENAARREAEQYTGDMAAVPPSEVRKFFDALGQAADNTTDAALSGLQYADIGLAGAFESFFDTIAPVMDPLAGTILPENPLRRVAGGLAEYRQRGEASAEARMPKGEGNLSAGYYSGIASLSRNLAALPVALTPGGQGAAMTLFTAPVYGQEYGKAKDEGKSTSTAIAYGGTQALIEYATEKLPLGRLLGDVKQGTPFFKLLARQLALEVPGEQAATLLQDLNEWAVLNPEKTFQDYIDARPDAAVQTLVATVVGTGGQVSLISGVQAAADKIAGRETRAQREQLRATRGADQLEQLMSAAAASMTRQRDPQSFAQLVQEAAEDSGTAPAELFIDAARLVELVPEEVLAQLPSVQEQLEEALATDGAVVIPIGEATATFAGTGFEQELVRNVRVAEDAWTAAEAAEGRDLLAQLEQEAQVVLAEQTEAQAWEESSKAVFDTLMGELTTAGRFAPDVNRAYATLVRNFYTVQAARAGTTPQELYARFPLTVSSRAPGAAAENTLEQEGPSVVPSEKPGALRVRGVHYSTARRPALDGRYFGTGLKGAERARLQGLPEDSPLRSRVLAYVDEGSGIRPEQGVGDVAHAVDLDNIYDTAADPLGIWQGNPDANAREQAVVDAGYDGYYVPAAMNMGGNKDMGVVALLGEAAYEVPTRAFGGERAAAPARNISEMQQALEEFRDHPDLQYGAPSARLWGVFTKMKAPELYEKLAPTGMFEGEEAFYKSDLIARVQGQDVFAQSVSLRDGRETLKKYGLDPSKKYKTREVAAALEARQRKKYGTIDRDDRSEEAARKIAKWMAEEVQFELQNPEKSGVGWYSEKFQRALDIFATEFPELSTDQNARDVMTALIAITSDGQKVGPNFAQAADIYGNFRESGKFTTDRGHQRQASIDNNLVVLQDLYDRMGAEGMREYLLQEATVSELRKVAKEQGVDFDTAYQASVKLPMAAVLLGPKLGAFYANLMGASGYLTMDRWWSRTFNRMRGVLIQRPTPQGIARVRELLDQPDLSDDQVLAATVEHRNSYEAKGFKNGTELEKAANTVYKAAFEGLEDAPFNATDRTFMLRSVALAKQLLKRRGHDISVADIQAILWYYEKRLYGELGARQSADISYEEAARQVVANRGNSAGRSDVQGTGQAQPQEAATGPAIGEEVFGETQGEVDDQGTREAGDRGGRYSSGSLAPLEGAPTVAGAAGPDPRLVSVAEQYARDNGIDLRRQAEFAEVDPDRATRIAQAYAEMRHAPNDPKVKEAYDDLIRQTRAQYDALVAAGYQFTLFDEGSDPYGGNPWNAMRDLRANQRMAVFATEAGFGVGAQVNIGLADPQGGANLDPARVIEALRAVGAEVEVSSVYSSDTEPTLVAKIKQALTKEQGDRVSEMLGQEAIAQRTDDEQGQLFGPMAEQWGPYNPAYFVTTTGERADAIANPLLQDTGLQWPNQNGEMRPVLANDLFRAVHDAFGHGLEGAGFRARGEENAWQAHVRLFTGPAVGAITTETRGQNSWLNYGPYGEQNQNAAVEDTVFAEQKTGLMPEWVWTEGRVGDEQIQQDEVFNQAPIDASLEEVLRLTPDEYLDLVNPTGERSDEDGSARLVRGDLTDPQGATVIRELDGGVTIERDAEGNVYARQGGDTIGEIINYGDEVNANVLPEARGAGVATAMVAEFIRANPVFNAGSLTAGGEAAVRAAFRQLQSEQVLNQSVPQTETEAFRNWFGDSKVVDAEGKPLVVYHGAAEGFDTFDERKIGDRDPGFFGAGFYFTPDEGEAQDYADSAAEADGEGNATVLPVFVSIQNPFVWDMEAGDGAKATRQALLAMGIERSSVRGNSAALSNPDERHRFAAAMKAAGHDGVIVRDEDGIREVVAFRNTQIKSATDNNGNFDPADPSILNQTGQARATFNPATLDIALLEKADLSSFLHETGHFFFEMQAVLAAQADAPQAIVDDMRILLDHVGFEGTAAEWLAKPVNARREAHEAIAESFEQYLFTGKAPTAALQPLFQRFRSWMVSVYRSLQEFLAINKRASLNPDIAAVFDRMLASEKAISDALAVRQFEPMFRSAEEAGLTPEAFAAYQADLERQQADALDEVQARTMRDLKWLDNARGRKLKELQKEAAAQRKAVRDEVTAEVNAEPVYRALEFLKYGRVESDGEQIQVEVTKAAKLNITEVQAMYPEGELGAGADWRSLGYGKYGMLSDAGLHPDTVAEMFGFRSGRQLIAALLEAEPKTELINGLTDQRMLERHGDISSPQAMQEAANEALANEARARLVATELAALTKATGKPGLLARAARQAAEQMVAAKPVRNLRPDLAAASAARARKTAEAAMAKGDTAAAAAAKRTEILQIQLERVQRKAQQEHDKALRDFKKIFKGTNEKVAKSRDIGLVNAARGVLARYGLAPNTAAANARSYAELLANYDGAMAADIASILQGLPAPVDFRELTVEQFRGMRDVVNGLYYLARRTRQVEIDGQKLELDAVADELVATTTERAGGEIPPLPGYAGTPTSKDKWMASLQSAKAALTRVEFWADNMGPAFKRYIWNPVSEATTRMRTKRTELIRQYRDLLRAIEKGITYNKIDAPELGPVGFTFNAGKSELLHAILHTGNKSNLTKLLLGRGWGTLDANGQLDTRKWDLFVTRMIDEGVLTKADFDFAQGVWDLLETVKKDAQAAHKEMYGYYFNEVTADPFQTPWGEYRGGYVPALADSLSSPEMAQKREQEDLLHAGNSFMFPTTGKGFTQSRVFFNKPLELDLRAIGSHLDKVSRFAYLEPTIRDVNQIISNKRVARALNGANPGAISDMLTPWLQRTARQSTSMPGKNPKVNRFFNGLRSRTGMVFMFGNVVNTLQQLTGFSLAALKVPAPKMLRATARYMANPLSMRAEVAAKSPWLAERMDSQSYAMQDQIEEILTNPGVFTKTTEFAKRNAYFLQQAMQNVMDPIVWTGAYDHALSKGVTEREAIRYADEAVRTTQGSFAPEDVSGFEVQSPFVRLFTQFYGYFNMWGNLLGTEASKAVREMGFVKSSPRLLFIWFAGVAVPSVVAEIIARGLPDDEDDEDGDGLLDEWMALFFGSQFKSLAATVPGLGHLAVLGSNMLDDQVYNDRFNISPAMSAAESAVRGGTSLVSGELMDEDVKKREVRDILTLIGLGTGLPVAPVARAAGYAADVGQGRAEPEGALDVGAGLLLGR